MIVVRNRAWSAMILLLVMVGAVFAQPVQRTNPNDKKEEKQELGPATAKTKDEAEAAVKAPVAIPVMPTAAPVDPKTYMIGPEDILACVYGVNPSFQAPCKWAGWEDHASANRRTGGGGTNP